MQHSIPPNLSVPPRIVLVGSGPFSAALAKVLAAEPMAPDAGRRAATKLPTKSSGFWAAVIVMSPDDTASVLVRHHRLLWRIPGMDQIRWAVIAASDAQASSVSKQDVYGREGGAETFGKWTDSYAVLTREQSLTSVIRHLRRLKPMWRSVWERHDAGLETLAEVQRRLDHAVTARPWAGRTELLRGLPELAWDCFCGHDLANRVRNWLARDEACNAWLEEGRKLLETVIRNHNSKDP